MAKSKTTPLPLAALEYEQQNESITRLTIQQALQEIENDVTLAKTQGDKDGSLAMRRFQFLLMGAS